MSQPSACPVHLNLSTFGCFVLLFATLNTPEYCPQLTLYRAVTNGLQTLPDFSGFVTVKWTETASMKLHVVQVPSLSHV